VGILRSNPKSPDASVEQRASNDLIRLIRKLRWMGMDDEAKRVQTELKQRDVPAEDSVLARPRDTDWRGSIARAYCRGSLEGRQGGLRASYGCSG
jgi:hypothetical protein